MGDSKSEDRLGLALMDVGLNFFPQYQISEMHVDFADPAHRVVVEVDGPHHEAHHQRKVDKGRDYILRKKGWRVKRVSAEQVYYHPKETAMEISEFVSHKSRKNNLIDLIKWVFVFIIVWNAVALLNLWIPALVVLAVVIVAWRKGYLNRFG